MVRMSTTKSKHALALYAFLVEEWDAMQIAPTTWCRQVGIADPTVYRWRQGVEPDMRSLRRVAEALGRPIVDILVAANYLQPDEVGGHVAVPRSYDVLEAINLDQAISDQCREALRQVYDAFTLVESGAAKKVRVRARKGTTASSRS